PRRERGAGMVSWSLEKMSGGAAFRRRRGRRGLALAVHHHAVIELSDGLAAGPHEEERQQRMDQAGEGGRHEAPGETPSHTKMLRVGRAHARRMVGKELAQGDGLRISSNRGRKECRRERGQWGCKFTGNLL